MLAEEVSFNSRLVRDLAWVIASPPLVSGMLNDTLWWSHEGCYNEYLDCLPALKELDLDPTPLMNHLEQSNAKRLGHRFESLVAYWIIISPNYNLLAKNIQVIKDGHTYGEIDFVIQNSDTQKIIHLEVAVKFYLGSSPYQDPFRWFGTNTKDQLGRKVEHLMLKQTQLGRTHSSYFKKLGIHIDERQCFLKGRLFYPIGTDTPPHGVTSNHLRGRWIQNNTKPVTGLYYPINKKDWLAEINHNDLKQTDIQKEIKKYQKSTCFTELKKNSSGTYQEVNRLFYLPKEFKFPL
ncbi:MAG: DUF1853 family protein [Cocleimonas sp.]